MPDERDAPGDDLEPETAETSSPGGSGAGEDASEAPLDPLDGEEERTGEEVAEEEITGEDEITSEDVVDEEIAAPKVFFFRNDAEPQRVDTFLAEKLSGESCSRVYIQKLIETGHVGFDPPGTHPIKPSHKIGTGRVIRIVIPPPIALRLQPEAIPIDFLYEDEHMAVIDKPAGLSVHPAPDQTGPTLVNALLYWIPDLSGIAGVERPGIVHRLDKETSGVMLVAKNDRAHQGLALQFKERTVHKTYQAVVRGQPEQWEGRINLSIGRSPSHSKKMVVCRDGTGRASITDYRVLEIYKGYALVECYPHTGRTHQIRVHMASHRMPVAADKLYGREKRVFLSDLRSRPREEGEEPIIDRQALHAAGISFRHPVTREEMTFQAPLPDDMLRLIHALQTYRSPR
ncbi:MAG: RluA family pseudouridine synthase [Planctomycetes bacterium]|nr:RluA family pseudouridine synthase [Planctomycetota bacterium]